MVEGADKFFDGLFNRHIGAQSTCCEVNNAFDPIRGFFSASMTTDKVVGVGPNKSFEFNPCPARDDCLKPILKLAIDVL
jgi:hypothetical protein